MPDRTQNAVESLQAAGGSVPLLIKAIRDAKFLESTPSPERQMLRAAKMRLKKALVEEEKNKGTAQVDEKVMSQIMEDVSKFEKICDDYDKLRWRVQKMPGGATRRSDVYYTLYGLMMQAQKGDNETQCPIFADSGNIDYHGRSRWDSWEAYKGLSKEEARQKFVKQFFTFPSTALYSDNRAQLVEAF